MAISNQDIKHIKEQLGREPHGVIEVSSRSNSNKPVVIKTQPLIDNEVFPTLYYLVDKNLTEKVSRLESEGYLAQLQERVENDPDFRTSFLQSQESYIKERNSLVDFKKLSQNKIEALKTGIGGVGDLARIKCLHCHLAHYLAKKINPVGKEVYNQINND